LTVDPGLGVATTSTDDASITLPATGRDLVPFLRLIDVPVALVMLSSAVYANIDSVAASLSSAMMRVLRVTCGLRGATITDDLAAMAEGAGPALRAVTAGVDVVLLVASERESSAVYRRLCCGPPGRDRRRPAAPTVGSPP
jgi:hypothetical protein